MFNVFLVFNWLTGPIRRRKNTFKVVRRPSGANTSIECGVGRVMRMRAKSCSQR
jgi:hypothetical protein